MYTFSRKLKMFSIILMALGILSFTYGYLTTPGTMEEVEHLLQQEAEAHGGHGKAPPLRCVVAFP